MQQIASFFSSSKAFIKDSGVLFLVNIVNSLFNYGLVIVVSNKLGQDTYSLWTALVGLIAILLTVATGIMTEVNKQISTLASKSLEEAFRFYYFIQAKLLWVLVGGILLSPLLGFFFSQIITTGSFTLFSLVVCYIFLQITQGINSQFFLGILRIRSFVTITLLNTAIKFIATISFLFVGAGVYAMPFGLIIAQIIALTYGIYLTRKLIPTLKFSSKPSTSYHIFNHLKDMGKNVVVLFALSLFLNSGPIIAERILAPEYKDILAILFNFGQIIHFAAISSISGLITHASRSASKTIYLSASIMVGGISAGIGIIFTLFGPIIMNIFGRPQYVDQLGLILYYSFYIAIYNLIFVGVQYLLAKNGYKQLSGFILSTVILLLAQFIFTNKLNILSSPVVTFITISSGISILILGYLVGAIWVLPKKAGQHE
jgi:O-antigen/teichoic acid export membrane protein